MKEADETIQYHPELCEGCPNFGVCKVFGISETKYDVDIIIETKVTAHKVLSYECPNKNNKVISGCFLSNTKSTMQYKDNLEALVIALNTCRDSSKTTTLEPLVLLGFDVFCDFFIFVKNSDNYVEKHLKNGIKVEFAI